MTCENIQTQIDALVHEIEDELTEQKTFNAAKHFALWKLDSGKAFEMLNKAMRDKSVAMDFSGM